MAEKQQVSALTLNCMGTQNARFVPYVIAPDSVMCLYHNTICAAIPEQGQWLQMEKNNELLQHVFFFPSALAADNIYFPLIGKQNICFRIHH